MIHFSVLHDLNQKYVNDGAGVVGRLLVLSKYVRKSRCRMPFSTTKGPVV